MFGRGNSKKKLIQPLDLIDHDINKWDKKHAIDVDRANRKRIKAIRLLFSKNPDVKIYGPYDQEHPEYDATYQYMKETITPCMIDESAQECDLKFYHIFQDMEKPISCNDLAKMGPSEIKEQFDVIQDLTHRTVLGDSQFEYIDQEKFQENKEQMSNILRQKLVE